MNATRMYARHHSREHLFRFPQGALPVGARVMLRCACGGGAPELMLYGPEARTLPMQMSAPGLYEAEFTPGAAGLYWYAFRLPDGQTLGMPPDGLGGEAQIGGEPYPLIVFDAAYQTPQWMAHGALYHIFVDRFNRGTPDRTAMRKDVRIHAAWDEMPDDKPDSRSGDNLADDFFGGTLNGIREKLPVLNKMGVRALYLSPIFSANSNHKYDTSDYMKIDPMFGTQGDFTALCAEAGHFGIRVILDGVFSHVGERSVYFDRYNAHGVGACHHANSPYADWFEREDGAFKYWWGVPSLPVLDKNNPKVRAHLNNVTRKWLSLGASGWRLDVADELPMNLLAQLRKTVKTENPDAALIGEVWEDASRKVSYGQLRSYVLGDTLDGVMNYPLRDALIGFVTGRMLAGQAARALNSLYENYPAPFARCLMNLIGSHDRPRILNVLAGRTGEDVPRERRGALRLTEDEKQLAVSRLALLWRMVCACPGMPTVYYGDEAGMQGAADPYNRGTYPWGQAPELLSLFQSALMWREAHIAPESGVCFFAPHPDVLVIRRGAVVLAVNRAQTPLTVGLPPEGRYRAMEGAPPRALRDAWAVSLAPMGYSALVHIIDQNNSEQGASI